MLKKIIFALIFTSYLFLITNYLITPYVGPYGYSHLQFSIAARNFIENGWLKTRLIPNIYLNSNYLNHPPLLYLMLAISYRLFGYHNLIGRLTPFLFSLGSAGFFYLLVKKYFGRKTAWITLLIYLTMPMFLFFGAFIQFEPLVLFFCLGTLYFLDKYLSVILVSRTGVAGEVHPESVADSGVAAPRTIRYRAAAPQNDEKHRYIFILISLFFLLLSFLSDFSGLIFAGLIIGYLALKKSRELAFCYLLTVICYLFVYLGYLNWINLSPFNLFSAYLQRANQTRVLNWVFPVKFISVFLFRMLIYFSPLLLIQFPIFPISSLDKLGTSLGASNFKFLNKRGIFLILLVFPIINIFVLPGGSLTHPYFLFFFIPIMALLLGLLFERVEQIENLHFVIPDLIWNLLYRFRLPPEADRLGRNDKVTSRLRHVPHGTWLRSKNNFLIVVFLTLHLLSSLLVFSLKIYQIKRQVWQYQVAKETVGLISKDQSFYKNWVLDQELFYWYGKKMSIEIYPPELLALKKYQANYYLFVCFPQCHKSDHKFLENLSKRFNWQKINVEIPSYIFYLKEKPKKEKIIVIKEEIKPQQYLEVLRKVKGLFGIEQI